jgi:hypothetical protein
MIIRYLLHCLELHCHNWFSPPPLQHRYSQHRFTHSDVLRQQACTLPSTSVSMLTLSATLSTHNPRPLPSSCTLSPSGPIILQHSGGQPGSAPTLRLHNLHSAIHFPPEQEVVAYIEDGGQTVIKTD